MSLPTTSVPTGRAETRTGTSDVTAISRDRRPKSGKVGKVGLISTTALGLASVAPAYSITVTLGFIVMVAGQLAPAAILLGFVPIVCVAFAFRELNRRMPDCGTNFVWITKAFGAWPGLVLGTWVPQMATVLAMSALSKVGAQSLLQLVGLGAYADSTAVVLGVGLTIIAAVTTIAYIGIDISARVQVIMVAVQLIALAAFGIAAVTHAAAWSFTPASLNPFAFDDIHSLVEAVLLALFIYWGWDAALTVNEESTDGARTPGRAAVLSTVILLCTYLFTAVSAMMYAGIDGLSDQANAADVLGALAPQVMAGPIAWFVQLAVALSAIGALLTCVIGSSRQLMSASRHGALPTPFARRHPVRTTPTFATIFVGAAAATMLGLLTTVSPDFVGDALLSIGLMICAYYSATGLACVWYFRHEFTTSARSLIMRGILPLIGAAMMLTALVFSAKDMLDPAYGSTSLFGVGGVFLLGVGLISLGLVVAAVLRARHKTFFRTAHRTITDNLVKEN